MNQSTPSGSRKSGWHYGELEARAKPWWIVAPWQDGLWDKRGSIDAITLNVLLGYLKALKIGAAGKFRLAAAWDCLSPFNRLIESTRANLGDTKVDLFGVDIRFDDHARLALPQGQEDQPHSSANA